VVVVFVVVVVDTGATVEVSAGSELFAQPDSARATATVPRMRLLMGVDGRWAEAWR
jgi:hypothetical protein